MLHECRTADEVRALAREQHDKHRAMFTAPRPAPLVLVQEPEPVLVAPEPEVVEEKSVESSAADLAETNRRLALLERQISTLMHMVGADERPGAPCAPRFVSGADVIRVVANYFGVAPQEISGSAKTAPIARIRHIGYYLCRKYTMLSLPKIGEIFRRDHTSVLHGTDKIKTKRATDQTLDADLNKIEILIGELLARRQEAVRNA